MGGVLLLCWFGIKKNRIGLSIILADEILLDKDAKIGHLNLIICHKLEMKKRARINKLNYIHGDMDLLLGEDSDIFKANRIFGEPISNHYSRPTLILGENARMGSSHLLDMCDNITIGDNSMLAGTESQIWTHSFYFSKDGKKTYRVDSPVEIGHNCYIGARCVMSPGAIIPNSTTIGANVCVSKPLERSGLYVSQPLRFIPFDPDTSILRHKHLRDDIYQKQ